MKQASRYIFKAILLEMLLALLTLEFFVYMIFSHFEWFPPNMLIAIGVGIFPSLVVGYILGERVDYPYFSKGECIFLGVLYLFALLTLSVLVGSAAYELMEDNRLDANVLLQYLLFFYVFGGVQTLGVGLWLGVKLSRIR